MPIDELKTKFDKSAKKSKVSIPIKELKTNYEEPTKKIKQDAEGLEPISIRTKKTKKIPIDNQIQKETKTIKLFDDGVRKKYRRKQEYDPNQKYRRYKSKVEAKLYENLVGEPEQSIVEAIREATEQLKSPSIRKIIRDTNIDNQDFDASEIRTESDVRQPKRLNDKQQDLEGSINKGEKFFIVDKKEAEENSPILQSAIRRLNLKDRIEKEKKAPILHSALIRLNRKNIRENTAKILGVEPTFKDIREVYELNEERAKKEDEERKKKLLMIRENQAARLLQKIAKQRGRPKGSKDKTPRKVRGTTKPFEIETASPITPVPGIISRLAKKAQEGFSPSLGRKLAHRIAGNKSQKIETDIIKQPTTPAMRMLARPSPRLLTYSPP